MRVMVWPAGIDDGCSWYRLLCPAKALQDQGFDVVVDYVGPRCLWDRKWTGAHPPQEVGLVGLDKKPDADVIVLQRPGRRYWAQMIPMLQEMGIRVVVDVDDNFDRIHRDHAAYEGYNPKRNQWHNRDWIREACRAADLVTVTTPALRDHYGRGRSCQVIPNYVPESYLWIRRVEKRQAVGWAGSISSHPHDLDVTRGSIARALAETDWGFHVVGDVRGVQKALGLAEEPTHTGKVKLADWARRVAELGIGIVPLEDSAFNHAKSALKMAEMASVGVPVVASATPDNRRLHEAGVGELAKSSSQWFKKVRALVLSQDYRDDLAGRSREAMAAQTYERHAEEWVRAWVGQRVTTGVG